MLMTLREFESDEISMNMGTVQNGCLNKPKPPSIYLLTYSLLCKFLCI